MKQKQQVVHIHGGMPAINIDNYTLMISSWSYDPFKINNRWSRRYQEFLGDDYEIIRPDMPNKDYANYKAWEIWFQKVIPYLKEGVILVGHSLGGGFLMKFLSINKFPLKISQLHLVAPTFDYHGPEYDLGDFSNKEFPGMFFDQSIDGLHIYHSTNDPEVPISESEKYHAQIPGSNFHVFEDRFHFLDKDFPELFKNIKSI